MNLLAVLILLVAVGYVVWELSEPWRLRERAMRKRKRQRAVADDPHG